MSEAEVLQALLTKAMSGGVTADGNGKTWEYKPVCLCEPDDPDQPRLDVWCPLHDDIAIFTVDVGIEPPA